MRVCQTTMLALLVGLTASLAHGQNEPPGCPPGSQGRHDAYQSPYYDPQPYSGYDREQALRASTWASSTASCLRTASG